MKSITIKTEREKAWPLFKLVDKCAKEVMSIDISEDDVEVRFLCNRFNEARFNWFARKQLV